MVEAVPAPLGGFAIEPRRCDVCATALGPGVRYIRVDLPSLDRSYLFCRPCVRDGSARAKFYADYPGAAAHAAPRNPMRLNAIVTRLLDEYAQLSYSDPPGPPPWRPGTWGTWRTRGT